MQSLANGSLASLTQHSPEPPPDIHQSFGEGRVLVKVPYLENPNLLK